MSDEEGFRARLREETARPRVAGDTFCVGVLRVGLRSGDQEEVAHVPDAGSLRKVAEAVRFTIPEGSTMAYLGGGMFAAVLPELRKPEAQGLLVAWEAAAGARLDEARLEDEVSVRVSAGLCAFQDGGFSGNREAKKIAYEMSDISVVRQPAKPRAKPKPKSKPKPKPKTAEPKAAEPTEPRVEAEVSQTTPPQERAERSERSELERRPEPEPERVQPQAERQERPDERPQRPAEGPEQSEERWEPPAERPQPSSPPVNLIDLSGNGHGNGNRSESEGAEDREDRAAPRNGESPQPGGSSVGRPERPDAPAS